MLTVSAVGGGGGACGVTVSVAERDRPFNDAPIVALNDEETDCVLIVKFTTVAPAGIVTLEGTVTIGALELVKETVVGDDEAALIVTVPCEAVPPATLVGFKVSADKTGPPCAGGVTVTTALLTESPKWAEMATSVGAETGFATKLT